VRPKFDRGIRSAAPQARGAAELQCENVDALAAFVTATSIDSQARIEQIGNNLV
jgi:hypothetical protein